MFSSEQWIAWLASTVIAAAFLVSYAYSNFETKDQAKDKSSSFEKRLDRVEQKLDILIDRVKR